MNPIFIMGSIAVDVSVSPASESIAVSLGGKGSNQAIAAKRAGATSVTLATKIGADAFGNYALGVWEREGLSADLCVISAEHPTGVTAVLLDEFGENRIIRGENASRRMDGSDLARFDEALPERGIFMTQLSSTFTITLELIRSAKKRRLTVILDPTSVVPEIPADIWECVDIITPNESEYAELGDVPVRCKIITLGGNGVCIKDAKNEKYIEPHKISVADTTGAGDAFNGAFAAALAEGLDIYEAAKRGNAAGAICASRRGAAGAMPYRREIDEMLRVDDVY